MLLGMLTPAQLRSHAGGLDGRADRGPRYQFVPEPEALALRARRPGRPRGGVLPLMVRGDTLVVAVADPWDLRLIEMLRFTSELRVRPVLPLPGTLAPALARAYRAPKKEGCPARRPVAVAGANLPDRAG